MSSMSDESEFGGVGGVIQPLEKGHTFEADRRGVQEQAMIARRHMIKSAREVKSRVERFVPGEGIEVVVVPYTEEDARADLQDRGYGR